MATLNGVKSALGITGTEMDSTLQVYFDEVVGFIKGAGISENNMTDGLVARGLADLWQYGGNEGKLSEYFKQRVTQLSYSGGSDNE